MRRLYFVALRNPLGDMLTGAHFLADNAAEAKRLGDEDFRRTRPDSITIPEGSYLTAKTSASKHPERFAVNA